MLNTINYGPRSISVRSETIERRAPTDESVRLLREMENQSLDQILSRVHIRNNTLEVEWVVFADRRTMGQNAVCRLKLNGIEHRIEVPIEDRSMKYHPERTAQKILEAVQAEIAKIITVELFNQQHDNLLHA